MSDDIRHHPSPALLIAYSAGSMPEAFNLILAAHLSLCPECRAQAESYDALGGALLEGETGAGLESSLAATFARIDAKPDRVYPRRADTRAGLPTPLHDYVGGDLGAIRWRPVGMGVKQAILRTTREATARLLFIPAGTAMPDHGHRGLEMTLVLQGAFRDESDYFGRGDVETADADVTHTPIADIGADCICLAVTDAPLTFSGLIPRIAQKFLRI